MDTHSIEKRASSITQISRRLFIAESTTRRLIRSGALPARRVGRQWRIFEADLQDYLARHANTAPGASGDAGGRAA